MYKKKNLKVIEWITTVALIVSLVCTGYFGYKVYGEYRNIQDVKKESAKLNNKLITEISQDEIKTGILKKPNLSELKKTLPKLNSYLYIPKIELEEVVMYGNNDYFLSHTPEEKYNPIGSVFLDSRNNLHLKDNYLSYIFAHNVGNGNIRFSNLNKLGLNDDFYLYQDNTQYKFKTIFKTLVKPSNPFYPAKTDPIDNSEKLTKVINEYGVNPKINNNKIYVILSTCKYFNDSSERLIILGELDSTIKY